MEISPSQQATPNLEDSRDLDSQNPMEVTATENLEQNVRLRAKLDELEQELQGKQIKNSDQKVYLETEIKEFKLAFETIFLVLSQMRRAEEMSERHLLREVLLKFRRHQNQGRIVGSIEGGY
jgi:hypothetical protein